ncbi:UDP pyrophosphate phosphatase [Candidatus Termititenax persephonae]|uniref:Undecaprenyl-diphosphatase n=1 Tax=Candidatus Termititenax persephonae TaxID=2218525 RepID=A0A388TGY8_9BACT|nr:UDP pyrophosphate phosphatase [Candidatus Termititenax persephonae]
MFWKAVLLGLIEGVTEFLPISSTGHLIIADKFIRLSNHLEFTNAFKIIIQLGAVLAVVKLYWERLWPFARGKLQKNTLLFWLKILLAVLPAAVLGFLFDDLLEAKFFNPRSVAVALVFYGIVLLAVENLLRRKFPRPADTPLKWTTALGIGFFQCLALIPGTSRSAVTIIGGLLLGLSRPAAAEFSFFLAVPTMLGAALLKLAKTALVFSRAEWWTLIVGFFIAYWTGLIVIQIFMRYLQRHNFKFFGWYRIVIGLLILLSALITYLK